MDPADKLSVSSFNCQSYKSSIEFICNSLPAIEILALHETWQMPNEIEQPSSLHPELNVCSTSSTEISKEILVDRPYGGLSFTWRKSSRKKAIDVFSSIKS